METLTLGPEYKQSYTGKTSLFYSLPKLGLFLESYLGLRKDMNLKWNSFSNFSCKQALIWFFSVIIQWGEN